MAFDFDEIIARRGTHSSKVDGLAARYGVTDPEVVAMTVADMDFRAPPAVNDAVRAAAGHGVHGYYGGDGEMKAAVTGWMAARHGWTPEADWIGASQGLVSAIGLCIQAFTEPGEAVVVFSPVYHMFGNIIRANGRALHESELKVVQGRHEMDLERLAAELPPNARMVLLCSPHNPGGRVWSEAELQDLARFCIERDLILVSDEIHHDLVFAGAVHHVMAKAAPEVCDRLVTLVAPSKTFNIAGGQVGFTVISNPELRSRLARVNSAAGIGNPNRIGALMATAAYADGAAWLDALLPYLAENRDLLHGALAERIPGVRPMPLESTYLAWVDFSALGLSEGEVVRRCIEIAKVAPHKGTIFGTGGEGWLRFNFAVPRPVLDRAVEGLVEAFA
ncbi:MAG TPA: PatB family C-S lyase [Paracoccaceae bacterium]|nr:PatB family C-S lyase [Paracoccaceae bacterium]